MTWEAPPAVSTDPPMTTRMPSFWLVAAVAAEVALAVANAIAGNSSVPTAAYVLPPPALALGGAPRAVGFVAAVAVVLTVVSGTWNDFFGSYDHVVRVAI